MKILGICGNYGKTSTCELLYQYLLKKNYNVGVCCSNGVFYNNITIQKNTFNSMCTARYVEAMPKNLDFLILEINEETMYSPENYFPIYQEKFECLCNVTYSKGICQKHADSPKFLFNIFDKINAVHKLCLDVDKELFNLTESYTLIKASSITFEEITFTIDEEIIKKKNIVSELELRNISAMVGVLKVIDEFDINILKNTFSELLIRGRFEKYIINGKKIILDTGWGSPDSALGSMPWCDLSNLQFILVPYREDKDINIIYEDKNIIDLIKNWRKTTGNFFNKYNIPVILTSNYLTPEKVHELYNFNNLIYIEDLEEALDAALSSEKSNIYIMGNYKFRVFRELLNK